MKAHLQTPFIRFSPHQRATGKRRNVRCKCQSHWKVERAGGHSCPELSVRLKKCPRYMTITRSFCIGQRSKWALNQNFLTSRFCLNPILRYLPYKTKLIKWAKLLKEVPLKVKNQIKDNNKYFFLWPIYEKNVFSFSTFFLMVPGNAKYLILQ